MILIQNTLNHCESQKLLKCIENRNEEEETMFLFIRKS